MQELYFPFNTSRNTLVYMAQHFCSNQKQYIHVCPWLAAVANQAQGFAIVGAEIATEPWSVENWMSSHVVSVADSPDLSQITMLGNSIVVLNI
jgi:hypothetical protein